MTNIVALHGFLGRPTDWQFLKNHAKLTPDLFNRNLIDPTLGLWEAGSAINSLVDDRDKNILVGYSLGGRIALHALINNPNKWSAAVIISAHTGITEEEERKGRLRTDRWWSRRFLKEPWDQLMESWNEQSVFAGDTVIRVKDDYDPEILSDALKDWSLGRQMNLLPMIAELKIPILWVTGEKDNKFTTMAKNVKLSHPQSLHWIAKDAAHRVPWEQQEEFLRVFNDFINEVLK